MKRGPYRTADEPFLACYAAKLKFADYPVQMHRDGGFTVRNPRYKKKKAIKSWKGQEK